MPTVDNVVNVGAESGKAYEAPFIVECVSMSFYKEVWEEFVGSGEVFQCFHCNCHNH